MPILTSPRCSRFAFRSLLAASALIVAPAAMAATLTIEDNADQSRTKTTTTYDAMGVPTVAVPPATNPTVVTSFYFQTPIDASYGTGFHADWQNSGTAGPNATTVRYSVNAPTSIIGGIVSIPASTNQDVTTTSGGMGLSMFTSYSALAQGMGWVDLKRISTNPPATGGTAIFYSSPIQGFGTYNDRSGATAPVVGYFIDATDYSGVGNLRWTGASVATVLAGNNTFTGDTFVAGSLIVSAQPAQAITRVNIGQGTLYIAGTGEVAINQAGSTLAFANAVSGAGALTFMGDTSRGSGSQTTTLTYDSVNYTGATRIESGVNGLNMIVLGDGSTAGATANTGTLGSGAIDVGRLDGNLGGGAYALTSLAQSTTAKLRLNLSGTKTLSNASINLHAQTEFENVGGASGDMTVAGVVTGGAADSVRITNTSGKLTFANTVSLGAGGHTFISNNSAKSLTFAGALTSSGQIDIANNSTGDLNLDGNVSGLVFIDQNGASKTKLTGNNSFVGVVSVNNAAGVLEFTNANALGGGTIKLAGGTLKLGGTTNSTISNAVNLAASANLETEANLTFTGAFTSAPSASNVTLTKVGAAALILTGNNDTFEGNFIINAGTLQAGNGGVSGTLGIRDIINNGTVTVNRSDVSGVTVANNISGTGGFSQAGTGLTIITGANTYTGKTRVDAGSLQVGAGGTVGRLGSGEIINNATLVFNRSDAITVANIISGSGNVVQKGTGSLALTGANTLTGSYQADAGKIVFGFPSNVGKAGLTFNGGEMDFASAMSIGGAVEIRTNTISNINVAGATALTGRITGSGILQVFGTGSLDTSGADLSAFSGKIVNGSFAFTNLAGSNLTQTNYSGSTNIGNTSATAATLTMNQTVAGTSAGLLFGNLSLAKSGSAKLTLSAINTYSGSTTISAGTLELTGDGTLGQGAVTVAAGAKLSFAKTGDLTVSSTLAGAGSVEQNGTGVITFTNVTGVTGSVVANAGKVVLNESALPVNATLVANGSGVMELRGAGTSVSLSKDISGNGSVRFSGNGTTVLATTLSNTGDMSVGSGHTLNLGYSTDAVMAMRSLLIEQGGVLQGRATLTGGSITNSGTFSPGNSPGVVIINGNYNQTSTGTLNIEIAGSGPAGATNGYDQIQYTGTANIAGGTLKVVFLNGYKPASGAVYQFLKDTDASSAAVSGAGFTTVNLPTNTFGVITSTASGLTYTSYNSLTELPGISAPSGIAGFASTLSSQGLNATTQPFVTLAQTNPGTASVALLNASPAGLAAMNTLAIDESRAANDLIRERLDWQRRTPGSAKQPLTAYANVTGSTADAKASEVLNGGANFDRRYFGGKVGLERGGRGGVAVGGNVGYDRGVASLLNGGGRVTQDHLSASGYISHMFDKTTFMYLGVLGGISKYEAARNTILGKAEGDTQGWDLGVSALIGKEVALTRELTVTPYAGVAYTHAEFSAYRESGNALALDVADNDDNSVRSKLGSDLDWRVPAGGLKLNLGLGLVWEHELLDDSANIDAAFAGSSSRFRVEAGTMAKDIIGFGPHAEVFFNDTTSVRLAYQYQYGFGDESGHRVDLTFSKKF